MLIVSICIHWKQTKLSYIPNIDQIDDGKFEYEQGGLGKLGGVWAKPSTGELQQEIQKGNTKAHANVNTKIK